MVSRASASKPRRSHVDDDLRVRMERATEANETLEASLQRERQERQALQREVVAQTVTRIDRASWMLDSIRGAARRAAHRATLRHPFGSHPDVDPIPAVVGD